MQNSVLTFVPLLAPLSMLLYTAWVLSGKGIRKQRFMISGQLPAFFGFVMALIGLISIVKYATATSPLLGIDGLGFSIRMDMLSMIMLTMIAILGLVILRFSENYLDGDPRQHIFFGRLATTIASVELLVLSGNLFQIMVFWIITSVCLHYLLVFYRHRPQAIAAARKKFIVARAGDISLFAAFTIIYLQFGTGELAVIFEFIQNSGNVAINGAFTWATGLLVIAAVLKSAQFPTHGWLIEVVETPTPVSALLHAGLLNAGPFLMVRMSYLLFESVTASMILMVIGGLTALFASVVYLTQPSIKVSLGYSSIAHMGFSLMLCGLGVYSAAILHIVGHSFYKAHSFLSSGSVIDLVKAKRILQSKRKGNPLLILLSIVVALGIFYLSASLWGLDLAENFSLFIISVIIIMGLAQLMTQTIDAKWNLLAVGQTAVIAAVAALSFLCFEHFAQLLLQAEIPAVYNPHINIAILASVLLAAYGFVVLIQLVSPWLRETTVGYSLGVHLRNGFYANVLFDRMIGSLKHDKFKWANLTVKEEQELPSVGPTEEEKEVEMMVNN